MVRALSHDRTGARGDRRHAQWQGQNREAQRRRESADRSQVRHPVDPDADDLQGGPDGFTPDRRGAEAEAGTVDHRGGVTRRASYVSAFSSRYEVRYTGGVPLTLTAAPAGEGEHAIH